MIRAVALDIDNTLVDLVGSAKFVMSADHGIPLSEIRETGIYWEPFTHADPQLAKRLRPSLEFWDRPSVLTLCQPLPGAAAAAWRLHNAGLLACYITRRPPSVKTITTDWLSHYDFPPVPVEHVGTPDSADYYERCKSTVCSRYSVTHMIDDQAKEAELLKKAGVEVILVDPPIGRVARQKFVEANPDVAVAQDIYEAVEMLLAGLRNAA